MAPTIVASQGEVTDLTCVTPKPMRRDAARNRELLIEAARVVFAQRGLEASLDDIARHAGLGVGTAYRHFANKHELARALIEQGIDRIVALAEQAQATADAWQGMVGFIEGSVMMQSEDQGLREVLTGLYEPDRFVKVQDQLTELLNQLVRRGQAEGTIRPDAQLTDVAFITAMLCTVSDIGGDHAPDIWRRYLAMVLAGLRPGAAMLPVPPLSEPAFREALKTHKQH